MSDRISELEAENKRLTEALAWCLDNGAYRDHSDVLYDMGCGYCSDHITPPEHLADLFDSSRNTEPG